MQTGDGRDQEVDGQGIGGGDAHGAGQPIIEALDPALQFQRRMLHFLHGAHRRLADRRQRIAFGGAQEQRRAQGLFQRRDPPPDGGLIDPQHPRGAAQRRFAADREKYPCVIPIHRPPPNDAYSHHCNAKSLHYCIKKARYAGLQSKPTGHRSCPAHHLTPPRSAIWLPIFAGLCASLVSIGLARFAYTPLIPSLIQAHWFSASDVVYLGAANLVGYLIGALIGHPLARRTSNKTALRLMMLAVTLAFFACAFPLSVSWFFGWRLLSGIAGGAIMVLVAATVLPHVPASRKGLASGAIFLGIGLGIAGSGTIVPPLLSLGLQQTWLGLGLLALILTAVSWFGWPSATPHATGDHADR